MKTISEEYRQVLIQTHKKYKGTWGNSGLRLWSNAFLGIMRFQKFNRVLDYGAGWGMVKDGLSKTHPHIEVIEYEPSRAEVAASPEPCEMVICHDVLEHVEPEYLDNVYLFDDVVKKYSDLTYNEVQLRLMANTDKFISVCGGNAILSSLFGRTTMMYITQGRELRPNYFGQESYWRKLSGANIIPIFDVIGDINKNYDGDYKLNTSGKNNFTEMYTQMRENF